MQPVEAQRGVSTKSQLFHSLKVYLNNKNRLQPIIGLGSIIECVKAGTHNGEAFYLCEVCVCCLSKADMRNHIMGSLHRYNYIKAWHPHLVSEWKENSDLSKLAWPLMEIAKMLEGKEGPGDVQLLEVEDAVYQTMATHSENDAVTLINILRHGQRQGGAVQLEHNQSQRIVMLSQNQQRWAKKSHKTSAETNKPPSLMQSTVAPSIKSEGWLKNTPASLLGNTQTSPALSVLSENSDSFLDGYTGTEPLIGLFHVVECKSEDGHTHCFLCHCCRIRSNKKDIIDHLTSSSHLVNYLMETHPEQVELMVADINDNYQLLQSLAKKLEQEEGRGELQVVNAPESLCILLTGKSYHWCIKMLHNGWTHTNIQKRKTAVKGPSVNKTSSQGMPEKCGILLSKRAKRKMKKQSNTVFKVSLPITKGSVLLERTSFSGDSLPDPILIPIPSPESQSEDCELDCELDYDTGPFAVNHAEHTAVCPTSQPHQDLYSGDADAGHYMRQEGNFTQYQEVDGSFSDNQYFNQSEDITGTKDQRQNEGPQTQNEGLSCAASQTQDWSSYYSSYGREDGCTEQGYNSTSQSNVGTRMSREERPREMSSDAPQYYYQQQLHNPCMAQDHTSLLTGSVGQHGSSGESAPYLDAAWINMHPHSGAHSSSIAPVPSVQNEQRRSQTYTEFTIGHVQTAPSYMTQPMAYQAIQAGHWMTSNPSYYYTQYWI